MQPTPEEVDQIEKNADSETPATIEGTTAWTGTLGQECVKPLLPFSRQEPAPLQIIEKNRAYLQDHGWLSAIEELGLERPAILEDPSMIRLFESLSAEIQLGQRVIDQHSELQEALQKVDQQLPENFLETEIEDNLVYLTLTYEHMRLAFSGQAKEAVITMGEALKSQVFKLSCPLFRALGPTDVYFELARHFNEIPGEDFKTTGLVEFAVDQLPFGTSVDLRELSQLHAACQIALGLRGTELLAQTNKIVYGESSRGLSELANAETVLGQGLRDHYTRLKAETSHASELSTTEGEMILLGAGRLVVFPLAALLRQRAGEEFKYPGLKLIELGADFSNERVSEMLATSELQQSETERIKLFTGDASLILTKICAEIDDIMDAENDESKVAARLESLLAKASRKKGLESYTDSEAAQAWLPKKLSFVVFAMAAQDFGSSIETYVEHWLAFRQSSQELWNAFQHRWQLHAERIEDSITQHLIDYFGQRLEPGGVFFYADPGGIIPVSKISAAPDCRSMKIERNLPEFTDLSIVHRASWYRPTHGDGGKHYFKIEALALKK